MGQRRHVEFGSPRTGKLEPVRLDFKLTEEKSTRTVQPREPPPRRLKLVPHDNTGLPNSNSLLLLGEQYRLQGVYPNGGNSDNMLLYVYTAMLHRLISARQHGEKSQKEAKKC